MKLEHQVINLQQAQRLKELGVKQESYFSWFGDLTPRLMDNGKDGAVYGPWIFLSTTEPLNNQEADWRSDVNQTKPLASAFTVAELGVMLPQTISYKKTQKASIKISRFNAWTIFYNRHSSGMNVCMTEDYNECVARGAMLINLLESKLITAEEVNSRI